MNKPLHEVVTASGNVLRGEFKGFSIESDGESWVNIIDDESRIEGCEIIEGNVVSAGGELVTKSWSENDWEAFAAFVLG